MALAPPPPPPPNLHAQLLRVLNQLSRQLGAGPNPPRAPLNTSPKFGQAWQDRAPGLPGAFYAVLDEIKGVLNATNFPGYQVAERGRQMGGLGGALIETAGYGLAGMQSKSELGAFGDFTKALGAPGSKPIRAVTDFADQVIKAADRLKMWSEQLHYANMRFAEFSGAMAAVQAEQEVRDIQLSVERGQRRAASARYLAEGKSTLERSTAPYEDFAANIRNTAGGFLDKYFAKAFDFFSVIPTAGNAFLDWVRGNPGNRDTDVENWLRRAGQGGVHDANGRPNRFGGPPAQ